MFILTQDGRTIINIERGQVSVFDNSVNHYGEDDNFTALGRYESDEKAQEVLQDIFSNISSNKRSFEMPPTNNIGSLPFTGLIDNI